MKKLIDPPIQAFFLLTGLLLLAATGWSLFNLKMQDENQSGAAGGVSVQIPDASVLDVPDLNAYPQMVATPLFWEARKAPEAPKVELAEQPVALPVDTALPEGRLIGIIDVGDHLFGVMQNATGVSSHLRKGDMWGAWKVSGIDPDRLILKLGDQEKDLPLVGDFTAPQENPKVAEARQLREQQATQQAQQAQQARQQQQAAVPAVPPVPPPQTMPTGDPAAQNAGLPFPADTSKQPPALSVKDALEARQRLMASRWGALGGNDAEAVPAPAGNTAGQQR